MDDIGAVLWDVLVACSILVVTVMIGAVLFWKRQEATSHLSERNDAP
jgi:hypothetical protein